MAFCSAFDPPTVSFNLRQRADRLADKIVFEIAPFPGNILLRFRTRVGGLCLLPSVFR